ncbi:hypothetical protein JCM10908_000539 [Rhodotorula pacifica]|uniref:uncharacterized protein n=1 Tax=Rhodotorula pacifica TaxID=1495444 RepID=UPI00317B2523
MGALFSRPAEPDYDSYLNKLQTQIAARQARLQQIRLRERRANALFITYGIGLWVLYSLLWWFGIHAGSADPSWESRALRTAPVILSPVAIICTRRVSRYYFRSRQDKEEKTLKHLVKQKQDKVEEIKKKTGYYSTRDLLEKYDEALRKGPTGSAPATPMKNATNAAGKTPTGAAGTPGTPARPAAGSPATPTTPQGQIQGAGAPNVPATAPGTPLNPNLAGASAPGALAGFPTMPPPTPHTRSIMDKVADALLGVSPEESNPYNKYALICGKCFSHNGLCPKDEFDFVQYRCPRCGFFNPRRKDLSSTGSQGGPPALSALDTSRHRRVHSEFAPSPLGAGASFARDWQDSSPDESTEMEEVPPVGAAKVGTSALATTSHAVRRRSRKAAGSDDDGDAEEEDQGGEGKAARGGRENAVDAMDMDD